MKNKKILISSIILSILLMIGIGFNSLFSNTTKEIDELNLDNGTTMSSNQELKKYIEKEKDTNELSNSNSDINEPNKEEIKNELSSSNSDINEPNKEEIKNSNVNLDESKSNPNTTNNSNKPSIEEEKLEPQKNTVTISISCQTAINNGINNKTGFTHLPSNGIILGNTTVEIKEGETVFEVLEKVVKQNKIHMEYSGSGSTIYIEGIHNLYEFDAGQNSGWMYSVNGWYPNYGCGVYKLKPNDVIKWSYTCDLGRDLGAR